VLGGQTVTNTGPTTLNANLGVSPGSAITGFPPGMTSGEINAGDAEALQAQSDLTFAYDDAAGRALTESVAGDLVGRTLQAGVYNSTGPLAPGGTLTPDAAGDPDAVFIFHVAETLITASASNVALIRGSQRSRHPRQQHLRHRQLRADTGTNRYGAADSPDDVPGTGTG